MKEYLIAEGSEIHELIEHVQKAMSKKWEPIGGICSTGTRFYQAMTRPLDEFGHPYLND